MNRRLAKFSAEFGHRIKTTVERSEATPERRENAPNSARRGDQRREPDLIRVRLDYPFEMFKGEPIGIDDVITESFPGTTADGEEEFLSDPIYSATRAVRRHAVRWAQLIQPLKPCEIGYAVVSGKARANLANLDTTDDELNGEDAPQSYQGQPVYPASIEALDELPWTDDNYYQRQNLNYPHVLEVGSGYADDYSTAQDRSGYYSGPSAAALYFGAVSYSGGWGAGPTCSGWTTLRCVNSVWQEDTNDCEAGCTGRNTKERAVGGLYSGIGVTTPCTDGMIAGPFRCEPLVARSLSDVIFRAPPSIVPQTGETNGGSCETKYSCRHRCTETATDVWEWVLERDCGILAPCRCPEVDTVVYPCGPDTCPRQVTLSCRATTTSTTTSNPPPTTTTCVDCSGECSATCDGNQWNITNTCGGAGNCRCSINPAPLPCDCYREGDKFYGTCLQCTDGEGTTTSSPPPTTTTHDPDCGCGYECGTHPTAGDVWFVKHPCINIVSPGTPGCCGGCPLGGTPCTPGSDDITGPCGPPPPPTTTSAPPTTTTIPPTTTTIVCSGTCVRVWNGTTWAIETDNCAAVADCECEAGPDDPGTYVGDTEIVNCGPTTTTSTPPPTTTTVPPSTTSGPTSSTSTPPPTTTTVPPTTTTNVCECCCLNGSCLTDTSEEACSTIGGQCLSSPAECTTTTSAAPSSTTSGPPPSSTSGPPTTTTIPPTTTTTVCECCCKDGYCLTETSPAACDAIGGTCLGNPDDCT